MFITLNHLSFSAQGYNKILVRECYNFSSISGFFKTSLYIYFQLRVIYDSLN